MAGAMHAVDFGRLRPEDALAMFGTLPGRISGF